MTAIRLDVFVSVQEGLYNKKETKTGQKICLKKKCNVSTVNVYVHCAQILVMVNPVWYFKDL